MSLVALALFAQLAAPTIPTRPVLAFPEPGIDDPVAYQGYQTRLFRDGAGNTLQIYIDARAGRVVHLWADADDESLGFTARDGHGRVAPLRWGGFGATVSGTSRPRAVEHALVADVPRVDLGWFQLGSMRVERDLQYAVGQKAPFANAPFALPDIDRLIAALHRLDPTERQRHLALLNAADEGALRARMKPIITTAGTGTRSIARVAKVALDGRDTLVMEFRTDPRRVRTTIAADSITLSARSGSTVPFTVRIVTSARPLTPLTRGEIFNPRFLSFLADTRRAASRPGAPRSTVLHARRLERQARGLELLSSHEKLMAGLPTYATYFGRDMLMTSLMMRPIWRDEMSEFVMAAALRKLSPGGQVSHEEALGGQAVREAASEYAQLIDVHVDAVRAGTRAEGDSLLGRARDVLRDLRRVRENYHMIDAEFQFPIVSSRWLSDPAVPAATKRAFLLDSSDSGEPRVRRLLRELALVARRTVAYADNPVTANLVSFAPRDSGRWASQSWRDSNVGYAGGRYAMDVNAIWAPHALESVGRILDALRALHFSIDSLSMAQPELGGGTPLGRYMRDSVALRHAVESWRGASRHFLVSLGADAVRDNVAARIAAMPADERAYWSGVLTRTRADRDSISFLAIALDAAGTPIAVANSDPATRLFLGDGEARATRPDTRTMNDVLRDVRSFTRRYPAGLLVDGVGPVVSSDAYASPTVWRDFDRDRYHGPHVVWGREVNLFLLGAATRLADAGDPTTPYARELRAAIDSVASAVEASGFFSELWSWEYQNGRVVPVRYGSGSDVQLWSTTDLAVAFAMSSLPVGRRTGAAAQPTLGAHQVSIIERDGLHFKDLNRNGTLDPYEDWRLSPDGRARDLVSRMTLEEKAGVMMHGTARSGRSGGAGVGAEYDLAANRAMITGQKVNSAITRLGGAPRDLAAQNNALQEIAESTRLGIPMTISTDPRNHFQYVLGASVQSGRFSQWPEVLGFAAVNDTALTRTFADIARQEYRAVGIHETLSPQADLATEPRWSRINGTFGEDATLAQGQVRAYVEGFQHGTRSVDSTSVLAVVKHWVGYGAAKLGYDSHNSYGRYATFPGANLPYHIRPFLGAFSANVSGVMPTYSILQGATLNGRPIEQVGAGFNTQLLHDLLRTRYGFTGVILTDWGITNDCAAACQNGVPAGERPSFANVAMSWGVEQLAKRDRFVKAVNAGIDQFGGTEESENLVTAVHDGLLKEARLDESVYRIVLRKFQQGLFENPYVDPARAERTVGTAAFQSIATQTQRRSLVLLENKKSILPLAPPGKRVYLRGIDPQVAASYGFIVVMDPSQADVAIVRTTAPFETLHPGYVFGAMQHEGNLGFREGDSEYEAIKQISAKVPTIVTVYLDRPAILTGLAAMSSALVANFGVSDAALLDVLTGKCRPAGKLPFELPSSMQAVEAQKSDVPYDSEKPLYKFGFGRTY